MQTNKVSAEQTTEQTNQTPKVVEYVIKRGRNHQLFNVIGLDKHGREIELAASDKDFDDAVNICEYENSLFETEAFA